MNSAHSPAFTRSSSSSQRGRPTPGTGNCSDGSTLTRHRVVEAVGCPKSDASVCRRQRRTTSAMVPVFSAASWSRLLATIGSLTISPTTAPRLP